MRPQEAAPLWVWLAFALMAVGIIAYLAAYFMIEDLAAFLK